MIVLTEPAELRHHCEAARARGLRGKPHALGVVPTMGALHRGHLALVEAALERAAEVVVTVFVNPTQFGPNEDFSRYPRQLEQDVAACASAGATAVFAPSAAAMYAPGDATRVRVAGLDEPLCGRSRPGHFEGVATIVTKLLALIGPAVAVFGRKDYQQLAIIRRLVLDLCLPTEVVGHRTVREPDGLALSSRNQYLDAEERRRALALAHGLDAVVRAFAAGERRPSTLQGQLVAILEAAELRVDYAEVVDADALTALEHVGERALVAVAAYCGKTRLIDNVVLGEEPSPLARVS